MPEAGDSVFRRPGGAAGPNAISLLGNVLAAVAIIALVIALAPAGRALERTVAAHGKIPKEQAPDPGGRSHRCRYRNR